MNIIQEFCDEKWDVAKHKVEELSDLRLRRFIKQNISN